MSDLYSKDILRLTTRIPHANLLENPARTSKRTSRICGSQIQMNANLNSAGEIIDVGMEVKACALGQATAAIVGENLIGLSADEFTEIREKFVSMVAGEDVAYPEKWQALGLLAPVKDHPGRKGSVMLPFECLDEIFAETLNA